MKQRKRQWCVKCCFDGKPDFLVFTGEVVAETELEAERLWESKPICERIPFFPEDVTERLRVVALVPGSLRLMEEE